MVDAAEREPAHVRVGVEVRDARLKRMRLVVLGRGDSLDEEVEQRLEVSPSTPSSVDAQPAFAFV